VSQPQTPRPSFVSAAHVDRRIGRRIMVFSTCAYCETDGHPAVWNRIFGSPPAAPHATDGHLLFCLRLSHVYKYQAAVPPSKPLRDPHVHAYSRRSGLGDPDPSRSAPSAFRLLVMMLAWNEFQLAGAAIRIHLPPPPKSLDFDSSRRSRIL
jgi:hypothetical protein